MLSNCASFSAAIASPAATRRLKHGDLSNSTKWSSAEIEQTDTRSAHARTAAICSSFRSPSRDASTARNSASTARNSAPSARRDSPSVGNSGCSEKIHQTVQMAACCRCQTSIFIPSTSVFVSIRQAFQVTVCCRFRSIFATSLHPRLCLSLFLNPIFSFLWIICP